MNRRARWRAAVYRAPTIHKAYGLNNAVRVLLLRLADDMKPDGTVSVPRSILAADLGVAHTRITERTRAAVERGWLVTVSHGRPGRTAVYQATFPDDWNHG
jgi:hypothetical protein